VPSTPGTLGVLSTSNTHASLYGGWYPTATWLWGGNTNTGLLNDYSGSVFNPYWGQNGCIAFHGGGHSGYWGNEVTILDLDDLTYKLLADDPSALPTRSLSYITPGVQNDPLFNTTYCEYGDGRPASHHSYQSAAILPPEAGGGPNGSLIRVMSNNAHPVRSVISYMSHRFGFTPGDQDWSRYSLNLGPGGNQAGDGTTAVYDPVRKCFWYHHGNMERASYKLDAATRLHSRTGWASNVATFDYRGSASWVMTYIPERDIVVIAWSRDGDSTLRIAWWSPSTPAAGFLAATLTGDAILKVKAPGMDYVPETGKLVLLCAPNDPSGVYEVTVPATLTSAWTVTRRAFVGLTSMPTTGFPANNGTPVAWLWGKWNYARRLKCFVFKPGGNSPVYVYRPYGV
jgi:hypothetical protein